MFHQVNKSLYFAEPVDVFQWVATKGAIFHCVNVPGLLLLLLFGCRRGRGGGGKGGGGVVSE